MISASYKTKCIMGNSKIENGRFCAIETASERLCGKYFVLGQLNLRRLLIRHLIRPA